MLYSLYFRALGTTRTCADRIAAATNLETRSADVREGFVPEFSEGDALLLSLPVYHGFVPNFCLPWLDKLHSKGPPAVIAGTLVDTAMGVEYLRGRDSGIEALPFPATNSPAAGQAFQLSSGENKRRSIKHKKNGRNRRLAVPALLICS